MKFFRNTLAVLFLMVAASFAQWTYPTGPNAGKATTPFDGAYFSATFNGTPSVKTYRSADNESSNTVYSSMTDTVAEIVTVRIIDHDIAVNYTSSDFYANDDRTGGTLDNDSTTRNVWCGLPYTYTFRNFELDGVKLVKRSRYIIVNSREVIFIQQIAVASYEDRPEWLDFEYSLRIK